MEKGKESGSESEKGSMMTRGSRYCGSSGTWRI